MGQFVGIYIVQACSVILCVFIHTMGKLQEVEISVVRIPPCLDMEQIKNVSTKTKLCRHDSSKTENQRNREENTPNNKRSDHAYQQIVEFLKPDKVDHFNSLCTPSERVQFIFKNQAFKLLLPVRIC